MDDFTGVDSVFSSVGSASHLHTLSRVSQSDGNRIDVHFWYCMNNLPANVGGHAAQSWMKSLDDVETLEHSQEHLSSRARTASNDSVRTIFSEQYEVGYS